MVYKCQECEGSGYCMACGAMGVMKLNNYVGRYVACEECSGLRVCMYCKGQGWFDDSGEDDDEDEAA